ncbi:PDZ domain-containing protein [Durusdinium trenchii]|uniref:PDZ domain-containing protein n=1 Tax=Durusdinium trenchii TaxID=1381693 RepID=A0ABP0M0L3_9DINO
MSIHAPKAPPLSKPDGAPQGLPASLPKNWWARRVRVSALQRKVAYLALKAQWKWNEVENICQRLSEEWQQPPLIALLLPSTAGGSAWQALESLSEKVVIEGFAETTYCGADVCLWVLRWACENTRTDPPAITLEIFASYVTAAMAKFHPRDSGPFLWPLHDKDIASAIAMCEYVGGDAPWWRKVLWGLRIVQPPGGTVLEECILDHYGREVGYVFAWANLFTRSLWVLTILCLFFYICGARAQLGGFQGVLWYVMQFCILCWAICLNALAGSRKSVLRSGGGGGFTNFRAQNNRTNEVRTNESSLPPGSGRRSRSERQAQEDKPTMQGAKTTALDALQRESWVTTGERPVVTANTHTWQDRRSSAKDALCPSRLMEGVEEVPQNRRREAAEKLQRALLKAKFLGWETKQLKVRRLNPDYSECRRPKVWAIFAFLVTVAAMVLFLLAAVLILFFFLNLKSHLIYVWGDCLRQGCNNPVQVHGMKGFFADISADIGLALVFVVLLGEVCKVLALHLAKLWNFKYMRQRQYLQAMLSLGIEVLAKVGVFSLIAFVFLPGWTSDSGKDVLPDVREVCSGYVDYQICNWMSNCSEDDPFCCAGSLLCAKDLLRFEQRRDLFYLWLFGPFIVCPFVDMIPAVLAPLIAKRLSRWAEYEGTQASKQGLCGACFRCFSWFCCCCCGKPLSRLLGLIFVLDAEVTGLRYLCRGQTFGTTELDMSDVEDNDCCERCIDGPFEQVVLREFDALDELKDLKLNFLFVVLFAPVLPWAIIPTLLARVMEVRLKITKLFLVRRRSFPRDAHLIHSTQETFTAIVTAFTVFWYLGLSLVTFNNQLHTWNLPELLLTWLGSGLLGLMLVSLVVRLLRRRLE